MPRREGKWSHQIFGGNMFSDIPEPVMTNWIRSSPNDDMIFRPRDPLLIDWHSMTEWRPVPVNEPLEPLNTIWMERFFNVEEVLHINKSSK